MGSQENSALQGTQFRGKWHPGLCFGSEGSDGLGGRGGEVAREISSDYLYRNSLELKDGDLFFGKQRCYGSGLLSLPKPRKAGGAIKKLSCHSLTGEGN